MQYEIGLGGIYKITIVQRLVTKISKFAYRSPPTIETRSQKPHGHFSNNRASFYRILAGIAEGLGVTSQILISEIASPQYRGTFFSLGNIINNCGSLFESFINAIFASYAVLTYAPTVLSFCLLPTVWWFVESPYYLVYAGRYDRAKASLAVVRVEHTVAQIDQEFETIKSSINEEKKKTEIGWSQLFATSSIRRSLLGLLLMSVFMPACGYTSLRLYMTISVPENAYFSNSVYPLICGASEFVASMWAVALMDRLPRRLLFTILCTLNALLHCFSGAMCYLYFQCGVDACKWGIIGGTFAYMTFSSMLAPLNDSIRMEILPYSIKGIGMALCMIIRSMIIVLCYKLYTLFEIHYGLYANYAFFAANSMCVVAVVRCMLPETGGKSLIEVQKALANDEKSPA